MTSTGGGFKQIYGTGTKLIIEMSKPVSLKIDLIVTAWHRWISKNIFKSTSLCLRIRLSCSQKVYVVRVLDVWLTPGPKSSLGAEQDWELLQVC